MIDFICGNIQHHSGSYVVIITNSGVGYGVEVPTSSSCLQLSLGTEVSLWIYTRVREDAIKLYGFMLFDEKEIFATLIGINGVGPKVALGIISVIGLDNFYHVVKGRHIDQLLLVPGIGKRSAEKIIVDLQAKIDKLSISWDTNSSPGKASLFSSHQILLHDENDLRSALLNLGYRERSIKKVLVDIKAVHRNSAPPLPLLIKEALSLLAGST